ncbi:MAG TPA: secondary thiamine-phosphate synthase enzyme YjbQ, partial [Methanotrichaceae archaeon]|nr:secondary thiamine-phosphate synthase enzyme YjbQ [Methanotrichaceae archaeon]
IAVLFVPGATGALTTIEHEPGLVHDLGEVLERLVPQDIEYAHNQRWHDGNGHSHIRASLIGPSITVPFLESRLMLGTWQQIVFLEMDNRPRRRKIIVQIMGEYA